MRVAILFVLGWMACAPAFAGVWSNLWRTPDQQGQALLTAGQPGRAAQHFTDPHLKAYADLQAGHYAQAASLLAPFKDATSQYNRGNALARTGHLRQALLAYDAALKRTPHDKDIRHNRNLVARMLKQHPPRRSAHGHGAKPKGKGGAAGQSAQKPGSHRQAGRQGRGAHGSGSGARHAAGKPGAQPDQGSRAGQSPGAEQHGASGAPQAAHSGASQTQSTLARNAARAAAIARREARKGGKAAASGALAHGVRGKPPAPNARGQVRVGGGPNTSKPKPVSEKTLALEQWLRQIPDDPAGLLRRQFMIDYMLKHPGANP